MPSFLYLYFRMDHKRSPVPHMTNQVYEHFSYVMYELEYPLPIVQHGNDKSMAKKSTIRKRKQRMKFLPKLTCNLSNLVSLFQSFEI